MTGRRMPKSRGLRITASACPAPCRPPRPLCPVPRWPSGRFRPGGWPQRGRDSPASTGRHPSHRGREQSDPFAAEGSFLSGEHRLKLHFLQHPAAYGGAARGWFLLIAPDNTFFCKSYSSYRFFQHMSACHLSNVMAIKKAAILNAFALSSCGYMPDTSIRQPAFEG